MIFKLISILGIEIPDYAFYFFGVFLVVGIIMLIVMALRDRSRKNSNAKNIRSGADIKEAIKYGREYGRDTKNLFVCPKCGIYGNSSNVCPECELKI